MLPDTTEGGFRMSDTAPDGTDERLSDATRDAEEEEAGAAHEADRAPTPEEEEAAEGLRPDPEVAEHEREMGRIGAEVRGEGQIT
jgi:hypothetical protein